MSKHLVFGAGLIGCYLGAALKVKGVDTTLAGRTKVKQKLQNGVYLTDFLQHQAQLDRIDFLDDFTDAFKADVIWLTVKCTGVTKACSDMLPFMDTNTLIVCCQNGLGSDAIVRNAFPHNPVVRAMVPFNVVELTEGHYHRGSEGAFTIEFSEQTKLPVMTLQESITSTLLPVKVTDDMTPLMWAKLQLNLGNSVNALADIPVRAMLEQQRYRRIIAAMMSELLSVAKAQNIDLPKVTSVPAEMIPWILRLPNFIFKRVANSMLEIDPQVRTSMWWDISQGKMTEIDHLNGVVIDAGHRLEISCQINRNITQLIKQVEQRQDKDTRPVYSAKDLCKVAFSRT